MGAKPITSLEVDGDISHDLKSRNKHENSFSAWDTTEGAHCGLLHLPPVAGPRAEQGWSSICHRAVSQLSLGLQ